MSISGKTTELAEGNRRAPISLYDGVERALAEGACCWKRSPSFSSSSRLLFAATRPPRRRRDLTDFEVHPNHVVDAIRNNPNYHPGEPVRLASCHSGADAVPPEMPLGQTVAHELGGFRMTGLRLIGTLLNGLETTGGRPGIAALCAGGGQGMAVLLERV